MKIYVDFDDCLCETARAFSVMVEKLFGKYVPYEKVRYFNLQDAFELTDEEYERLMIEGHRPENILALEETPGAAKVLNEWAMKGHEVSIITGRPFSAYDSSRKWLDDHGLGNIKMYCLNKYGRDTFIKNSDFNLELEDYYKMHFDYAVEDSPMAFKFFDHLPDIKVMVYDRPWNRENELPNDNYCRCFDWEQIREIVD
ncbi:MAG: 2-dehydropantoate 2-reductase [Eubacterium sp.]|nr:2-dehydropantoate 2-reductase [Eubacterium sp.]